MTRQLLFALAALCCASGQAYDPSGFYEIKTDYTKLHYLVEKSNVTIPVQVFIDGKSPESEKDYFDAGCEIRSSDNDVVTTSFYTSAMDGEPFLIEPKAKGTATLTIKWGYMTHKMQVMVHEDFSVALYDGETAVDNITLTAGEKKTFTVRKTVDGVESDLGEGDKLSVFNGQFYNCTKSGISQITFEGTSGGAAEQETIATIRLLSNDPKEYYDNSFTKQIQSDITVTQNDNFERTDFRDETVYHALITRFYDGDPKNNVLSWNRQGQQSEANDPDWRGDFAGLIAKLDYIKALGFTAIRINPVVQNGSARDYLGNFPADFNSVDLRLESRTAWGATADVTFKDFVDAAHAKGLKVVLDVVLNSISAYGESRLVPMFLRNGEIKNQASESAALTPAGHLLSTDYAGKTANEQHNLREACFTTSGDVQNLLHHYGTGWNWDTSSRWWGRLSSDKVDLNTEHEVVAQVLLDAYGKFIAMGVDAFCISDAGFIAPLTLNKLFIPQFAALGEKHKDKRPGQAPFAMFADITYRFNGNVVYRGTPNMSPYFYTWQSADNLLAEFDGSADKWAELTPDETNPQAIGPMAVCVKDTDDKGRSTNAWLASDKWHEPDHSQASGLYVVDTPMLADFSSAGNLRSVLSQDNYYNDATFNMVCVDTPDGGPLPSSQNRRFSGTAEQWAENLTWMFTFRGIPTVLYGSEVEFQNGCDLQNINSALVYTGHAYFGQYLEGNVSASDFGDFTAEGNVAKTLGSDLAQHIIALNKIRAAVPALRKGQYTFNGCSSLGGLDPLAFKRAWKDESYALVVVNGGTVTFTGVPDGTYTDIVTGKTYTPSTKGAITVSAPATKGQLNVLVKDWTGGRVIDDGKFIYAETPAEGNGTASFTDPGTTEYFTANDADTPSGISAPEAEAAAEGEVYYNLQGIEVKHPSHGIYIMRRGTTLRKISL